jgi:hypothetical protein
MLLLLLSFNLNFLLLLFYYIIIIETTIHSNSSPSSSTSYNNNHHPYDHILPTKIQPLLLSFLSTIFPIDSSSSSSAASSPVFIRGTHNPPASMEGSSVVYILHIYPRKPTSTLPRSTSSSSATTTSSTTSSLSSLPGVFYVGESESLSQRLLQHRRFYQRAACLVSCLVINVSNKSQARQLETMLIHYLKQYGVSFDRDADVNHSLFSKGLK